MQTLVIVSHPKLKNSYTQSFLKAAQSDFKQVVWHPLDLCYPKGQINVAHEHRLLMAAQRIIFQFPLYWYSSPALLKKWEDQVLTRKFANARQGGYLRNRQFGLVITLGVPLKNYQAGSSEHYSLSEILIPFRALAQQTGMRYLPPFKIAQFFYKTPEQEAQVLVDYRYYLTGVHLFGLQNRTNWVLNRLKSLRPRKSRLKQIKFDSVLNQIAKNRDRLTDLRSQINLIKRKDE